MSTPVPQVTPRLRRDALTRLPAAVSVPTYRSEDLDPGLVHIGVGRFHRAHQAAYFDRIAEERHSRRWGAVGVGMRTEHAVRELARQDHLYTLCERHDDRARLRVVGHLQRSLFAPRERTAVLAALAAPATKLVSLTVTAPTYVEPVHHHPEGVFALLAEALRRRQRTGVAPFTVLSCDNVPDNGAATKRQVLAAAGMCGDALASWIDRHVAFPATMVDRITPPPDEELLQLVVAETGVSDPCAVATEPFSQWVVEDAFCNDRPPLEHVGVQVVDDVGPYKVAKTRLVNGSHCALGYLGAAAGFRTSATAMADPLLAHFVRELMREEIAPLLRPPAGLDLDAYQASVLRRISTAAMPDPLTRLCARGSVRIPAYVLPSVADALRAGAPHRRLTLVVAAWVAQLRRTPVTPDPPDPSAELLQRLARQARGDLRPLLRHAAVFGDLGDWPGWVDALQREVRSIERDGARAAMMAASARRHLHAPATADGRATREGAAGAAAS